MTWSFDGAADTCSTALCHVCICGVGGWGEEERERRHLHSAMHGPLPATLNHNQMARGEIRKGSPDLSHENASKWHSSDA